MEITKKPRLVRILSGTPAVVEAELEALVNQYVVTTYNFAVVKDELIVTMLCLHESEIRKMQIAAPLMNPNSRR